MNINIPFLEYHDIGEKALDFLRKYHPSFDIPIPIEKIVDVKLGMDIIPIPNLWREFNLSCFLSRDLTAIYVDEYQSDNLEEKYRYSLAHEIGHYVLHKSFYEDLPFHSIDEYIQWRESIPRKTFTWFEKHGDWFAEQLLVPTAHLIAVCKEVVQKNQDLFADYKTIPDDAWSYISNEIADYFGVNPPVVEIRIRREKISQMITIVK